MFALHNKKFPYSFATRRTSSNEWRHIILHEVHSIVTCWMSLPFCNCWRSHSLYYWVEYLCDTTHVDTKFAKLLPVTVIQLLTLSSVSFSILLAWRSLWQDVRWHKVRLFVMRCTWSLHASVGNLICFNLYINGFIISMTRHKMT